MGFGVREPDIPDTYGLPEHRVTKIIKQRVGDEIHFLCGSETFGTIHWHCILTMKVSDVVVEANESLEMALLSTSEHQGAANRH